MKIILTETQMKKLVNFLWQQQPISTINDPKDFILVKKDGNGKR
jgi:hypothetical protein